MDTALIFNFHELIIKVLSSHVIEENISVSLEVYNRLSQRLFVCHQGELA